MVKRITKQCYHMQTRKESSHLHLPDTHRTPRGFIALVAFILKVVTQKVLHIADGYFAFIYNPITGVSCQDILYFSCKHHELYKKARLRGTNNLQAMISSV